MRFYRRQEINPAMLAELAQFDAFARAQVGPDYRWPLRQRDWELAQVMRAAPKKKFGRALETGSFNTFLGLWLSQLASEVVVSDRFGHRHWKSLLRRVGLAPRKDTEAPYAVWQHTHERPGVRLQTVDLTTIPFADGEFDLVTCVSVIEHIPDYKRALAEMVRVLAPGGKLLLTTDATPESGAYQDGVRYFSPEELRDLVAPYSVTSPRNEPDFAEENWCYGRGKPIVTTFIEITKPGGKR